MAQRYAVESLFGEAPPEFVEHVPHCRELGMSCSRAGPRAATMVVPHRDALVGHPGRGVVFGGVVTTLLDQAGCAATLCSVPELVTIATIDPRIDDLRAATPGRDLYRLADQQDCAKPVAAGIGNFRL